MSMNDCIIPNRKTDQNGYIVMPFQGRYQGMHRVTWQILNGPIPKGMHIDHACHNEALANGTCKGGNSCSHRACINPAHLQMISHLENVQNGARVLANNTHCKKGHEVATNLEYRPTGLAFCRACRTENNRLSNMKLKERLSS